MTILVYTAVDLINIQYLIKIWDYKYFCLSFLFRLNGPTRICKHVNIYMPCAVLIFHLCNKLVRTKRARCQSEICDQNSFVWKYLTIGVGDGFWQSGTEERLDWRTHIFHRSLSPSRRRRSGGKHVPQLLSLMQHLNIASQRHLIADKTTKLSPFFHLT